MNNLKRVLSLGLSGTMLAGMMTVAGAANYNDFTDIDEIVHTEAVETLVALNVIAGKDTGAFDPNGSLTRAEMAKLTVFVLHGGKDPVLGVKANPTFSDIKGHWAESYIEYCASTGIINGQGDGTFDPNGTLTGEQAAKMLLTAMNYKADVFNLTGADWAINTNVEANKAGLYDELSGMNPSATITRDQAAQLVYNAIQAKTMERSWSQDLASGKITETYGLTGDSLLEDKFNAVVEYAYINGYTYDEAKATWAYNFTTDAAFGGSAISTDALDVLTQKTTNDYTGLYGQRVKVIYESGKNDKVFGIYANDSTVLETGVAGDFGTIDATANTVKINGTAYKAGTTVASLPIYLQNYGSSIQTLAELKAEKNAFTFKAVDNNTDGKVDAIVKTPVTVAKINYVGSSTVTLSGLTSYDPEDIEIYEGYAKNDWTIVTAAAYSATGRVTVEKAELQTGTIEATRTGEYRIDGSWLSDGNGVASSLTLNDTVEYVSMGGYVFYIKVTDAATTTKDIAMVITADDKTASDTNVTGTIVVAKIILTDGTTKTVTVSKVDNAALNGSDTDAVALIGKLATYKIDSDGNYELTTVSGSNLAGFKGFGSAAAYSNETVGGKELADDAVVFFLEGTAGTAANTNKGKIYTGKELKNTFTTGTFGTAGQALYNIENGFSYAKVAVVSHSVAPTIVSGDTYGYLVSSGYNTYENEKTYINLKFWDGEKNVEAKWESTDSLDAYKAGVVITYDTVSENEVKNVTVVNATLGTVQGWDGSEKLDLGTTYKITSDTVILVVNSKDAKGVAGDIDSISIGEDTDNDDVADVANIRYTLSGTNIALIVVDVENKMQAAPVLVMSTSATAAQVSTALASTNKVIIEGDYTVSTAIAVGEGKTLEIRGEAELNNNVSGDGTLVVTTFKDTTSAGKAQTKTVKVTGSDAKANLEAIAATETLIIGQASSDAGSSGKWYETTGKADTKKDNGDSNNDGVAATELTVSTAIPAGTYVKSTVYTDNVGTTASAWVKQ